MRNAAIAAILGTALLAAPAMAADQAAYDKALNEAKAAIAEAKKAGGEWRDTGKLVKAADAAAEKGDFAAAVKKAEMAKFQAETGIAQAKDQAGVGNPQYIFD